MLSAHLFALSMCQLSEHSLEAMQLVIWYGEPHNFYSESFKSNITGTLIVIYIIKNSTNFLEFSQNTFFSKCRSTFYQFRFPSSQLHFPWIWSGCWYFPLQYLFFFHFFILQVIFTSFRQFNSINWNSDQLRNFRSINFTIDSLPVKLPFLVRCVHAGPSAFNCQCLDRF